MARRVTPRSSIDRGNSESSSHFEEALAGLRRENELLVEQVKRLVKVEQELNDSRADLDRQLRWHRKLYELGKQHTATFDVSSILKTTSDFVIYDLNFERCLILLADDAGQFRVRHTDGYFDTDASATALSICLDPTDACLEPLLEGSEAIVLTLGEADRIQLAFREATGLEEYFILPIHGESNQPAGLIVVGNSGPMARYQTRVEQESEVFVGLANLAGQVSSAIKNEEFYHALEEERSLLEHKVEERTRELEIASRHKSEFLANMSHELRTPLNAIIGFSDVLLQKMAGGLEPKQEEYLEDILTSGRHLLSLINDILDLSKVEAGRMDLDISTFSLREALEASLTMVRERAADHSISLSSDIAQDLGFIAADERKVKQVLFNLLSNAVKFTPNGGRVELRARREAGNVVVDVIDNGVGIAREDQAAIFDEFWQARQDGRSQEGTGLGLALTKKLIELHGGNLLVESAPDVGSIFTFSLPLHHEGHVGPVTRSGVFGAPESISHER